jgi:hypothetical protein
MEDRLEQPGDHLIGAGIVPLRASWGRGHDARQAIEELLHPWCQRRLELLERTLDVRQQVRAREALDQRAAEIQRAQFGERQAAACQRAE